MCTQNKYFFHEVLILIVYLFNKIFQIFSKCMHSILTNEMVNEMILYIIRFLNFQTFDFADYFSNFQMFQKIILDKPKMLNINISIVFSLQQVYKIHFSWTFSIAYNSNFGNFCLVAADFKITYFER